MAQRTPVLEIHLFGAPRLALDRQDAERLRRKNRALIYYLAAHDKPFRRENLLTFFWPDHERATAQPILRTMIHDLRKYLGEAFQADDSSLSLSPDTKIDARTFSALLHTPTVDLQNLKEALSLYQGDFLDGFSLADTPQFDEWAASERERYRLMAMRGCADLSGLQEGRRDYPAALESMRRALAFNPFQEDLQREVMRLLYLNGDRAGVIRQYEALRKLLDEEMGVPPMPETRSLYDSIINDTFIPAITESVAGIALSRPAPAKSFLPFIGRDTELKMLMSQLGPGKLILLEGEPGIGKTRLASELITSRVKQSDLVLQGVAHELEQILPYQPIVDALRGLLVRPEWKSLAAQLGLQPVWLTELARLVPELLTQFPHLPAPSQPADESRLWEALLQFFLALSRRWTIWLFLDDLNWADNATIGWLGYFVRHVSSSPILIIGTSRPVEAERSNLIKLLQTLKRQGQLVHLSVSTLTSSAMREFAMALSPTHEEELLAWLIENAEGNPFFITELVRYAMEIGLLKPDGTLDAELSNTSPVLPATIQNLIESRLLRLTEHGRQILHLAAVIGREFDFELVRNAGTLDEPETLDAIEELQSAHLIRPLANEKFAFDHSLTMQVALQDMSDARRHTLHRRVAETLEVIYRDQLDSVSGLIAHHFVDGNLPVRAAPFAFRAGQSAANLAAWTEAIAFYEQALSLEMNEAHRAPMYLALGHAHFHKGDFALASSDYQLTVDLAQKNRDWPLLEEAYLGLNLSLIPQARFSEAVTMAKELRELGPSELAACAEFIWGASLSVESAHPVEAEYHLHEAERLLQEQTKYSGPITMTQIKYQLAGVVGQQGRSKEAIELYREVLDALENGKDQLDTLRHIMLYNNLAYHLQLVGDAAAEIYIQAGIKLAREKGSLSHLPYLYSTSGEIALSNGDLDTAEKFFRDGLALAEQIPIPERIAGMTANLGLVSKRRGELDLAREQLQSALQLIQKVGNHHLEVRIRIWLAPLLPAAEARACLEAARSIAQQDGLQSLLEEIDSMSF